MCAGLWPELCVLSHEWTEGLAKRTFFNFCTWKLKNCVKMCNTKNPPSSNRLLQTTYFNKLRLKEPSIGNKWRKNACWYLPLVLENGCHIYELRISCTFFTEIPYIMDSKSKKSFSAFTADRIAYGITFNSNLTITPPCHEYLSRLRQYVLKFI